MNYLANIDTSAHDRMMHKYARYFKTYSSRAHSDDADEQPLLCIEGHAVVFDEPILNKEGEILVFERGCFDDHFEKGRRTDMWLAHDENEVVGSTNSGLELLVTDEGLAFRLPLTNKRYDSTIERMVESGTQSAI